MLNIKRPETYDLAKAVAARTGLSLTDAVTLALREKLAGLDEARQRDIAERMERVRQIARDFREAWGEPLPTREELDAEMYDEYGAPK
jgi:antitoxin VapB